MTKITIKRNGNVHEVKIEGHACFSKAGTDIVCAAVSTLAYTLLNRLQNLVELERVEAFEHEEADGYMRIVFESDTTEAFSALETIKIGFLMLEENFSKFVSLACEK